MGLKVDAAWPRVARWRLSPIIEAQHHEQVSTTSLQLLARDTGGTIWEEGDTVSSTHLDCDRN